jgi:manganese/zinc/iron transport system permease protein
MQMFDLLDLFRSVFTDYTLRTVAMGAAVLGLTSGALGSFAMLRRQSLLGDALSHAALPGVILAFMITGGLKNQIVLMLGAAGAGLAAILLLIGINRYTRIKEDSALGIILSVFFGFGLLLLSYLQRNPDARQAGLTTFLFGQAATLLQRDVIVMAIFGSVALLAMVLFWKEFKLLSFDRDFGASLGFPMQFLEILLTGLLVIAVVIGLQAVGVVLMSAMIVAPAAAARQWTNRLGVMVLLAGIFGALAGMSGAMISSLGSGLSTGPVIVLCISGIVLISLLFAPNRGLLWNWMRQRRNRRRLQTKQILDSLYWMAKGHEDLAHPHSAAALRVLGTGRQSVQQSLDQLAESDLIRHVDGDRWALTPKGIAVVQQTTPSLNGHREDKKGQKLP